MHKRFAGKLPRLSLFAVCAAMCVLSCSGCYLIKQGRYVLKYSTESRRMEKLQQSAATPPDVKDFIALVEEIRRFSSDSVGLVKNDNFSKYVEVHGNHIVDVVYAAAKVDFAPYTWRFPLFGIFPNKGFFERGDAQKEADKLAAKGYDVCILPSGAFSTLGFFSDPVYSYMKRYSPFRLAFLIFHEQTHATLFIKNQVQFNEELAVFIGREGSLRFTKSRYGDTSGEYTSALNSIHDEEAYCGLMRSLYGRLKAVYDSAGLKDEEKVRLKVAMIARFRDSVSANYDSLFRSPSFRGLSQATINNATLVAEMTYTLNLSLFRELFDRKNRDFKAMLSALKTLKKKKGDLHAFMKGL